MWLSFNELQISRAYEDKMTATYDGVSFFHVLFVEDILSRLCLWRSFPVRFRGGNLFVGQHLPELRGSIDRHVLQVAEILEIGKQGEVPRKPCVTLYQRGGRGRMHW